MTIAYRDAGAEMHAPQKGIQLHGGIYKKIRHPGAIGEMPLYVVVGMLVNSLLLKRFFFPLKIYEIIESSEMKAWSFSENN